VLLRRLGHVGGGVRDGEDVPVRSEVLAQDGVIWFTGLATLQIQLGVRKREILLMKSTNSMPEILAKRESKYCKHTLERVFRIIDTEKSAYISAAM
jgi:hypothetical protein